MHGESRAEYRAAFPSFLFCGINPGLRSAAAGAYFAKPRNDFWPLLAESGLTPRRLEPEEQWELLELGLGSRNGVFRTTRGNSDLAKRIFAGTAERLGAIARELRPGTIAFVGKAGYEGTFRERPALGLQERKLAQTAPFVLPSTSPAKRSRAVRGAPAVVHRIGAALSCFVTLLAVCARHARAFPSYAE